jgi:hypothetical protein
MKMAFSHVLFKQAVLSKDLRRIHANFYLHGRNSVC